MAWSSSFVSAGRDCLVRRFVAYETRSLHGMSWLGRLRSKCGSSGRDQVPMWMPAEKPSGRIWRAVTRSMSLAAAGLAGWKSEG